MLNTSKYEKGVVIWPIIDHLKALILELRYLAKG